MDTWAVPTVADKYGGAFLRHQSASPAASGSMSELPTAATTPTGGTGATGLLSSFHPSTGMFALAVIAAASFGLMAFSTTVRVGHGEAHVGVGKT